MVNETLQLWKYPLTLSTVLKNSVICRWAQCKGRKVTGFTFIKKNTEVWFPEAIFSEAL